MTDLLRHSHAQMAVVPLGIRMDGYQRARRERPRSSVSAISRAIAPEKGLHVLAESYVHLRRRMGRAPARLVAAGYMAPTRRRIWTTFAAFSRARVSTASSPIEARSIATASWRF